MIRRQLKSLLVSAALIFSSVGGIGGLIAGTTVGAAVAITLSTPGCVGQQARTHALTPAVKLAWTGVKEDIERGPVLPPPTYPAFASAIEAGDRTIIPYSVWPTLAVVADANIDASAMSTGVKDSHHERIRNFTDALATLSQRP